MRASSEECSRLVLFRSILNVRELVTMMASLYPHPLESTMSSSTGIAELRTSDYKTLGRPDPAGPNGHRPRRRTRISWCSTNQPPPSTSRAARDFGTAMRAVAARGKTVVFATHYLEEADAYADRVVLMARGQMVADGPPIEIKARVGGRTIRATTRGRGCDSSRSVTDGGHASRAARRRLSSSPAPIRHPQTPSCAICSLAIPRPATSRCAARGLRRRS